MHRVHIKRQPPGGRLPLSPAGMNPGALHDKTQDEENYRGQNKSERYQRHRSLEIIGVGHLGGGGSQDDGVAVDADVAAESNGRDNGAGGQEGINPQGRRQRRYDGERDGSQAPEAPRGKRKQSDYHKDSYGQQGGVDYIQGHIDNVICEPHRC